MSPLFCPDLLPLNNRHRKDKIRQSEKSIRANIPKCLIKKREHSIPQRFAYMHP